MQDLSDLQILNHSSHRTLPGIVSPESAKLYLRNPLAPLPVWETLANWS
jgi:hypothetical protein